jgi:hypothetical protein
MSGPAAGETGSKRDAEAPAVNEGSLLGPAVRPVNPVAAMTLVLVFPRRTFERLRHRPHWFLPLLFVAGSSLLSAVYAVRGGFMDEFLRGEAARTGAAMPQVESSFLFRAILMAVVAVPLVTLLEAVLFRAAAALFGGRSRFSVVFGTVAYASIPAGVVALFFAALMSITGTARAGVHLGLLVDPVLHPALWSVARQIDLASLWFFTLLGIAAEPVFGLPRRKARLSALVFALVTIALMSFSTGGVSGDAAAPPSAFSAARGE